MQSCRDSRDNICFSREILLENEEPDAIVIAVYFLKEIFRPGSIGNHVVTKF